jgi:uncharacterized spore protein YtfJ
VDDTVEVRTRAALRGLDPPVISRLTEAVRAGLVFGEPVTADGVTVIPAAKLTGGAGGGGGSDADGDGGGLGFSGRPVGAFVVRDGAVRWQPAFDVDRLIAAGSGVVLAALLTVRGIVRARRG